MTRITEQPSLYNNLEQKSIEEITACINTEDKKVALAIEESMPQLNSLIGRYRCKSETRRQDVLPRPGSRWQAFCAGCN